MVHPSRCFALASSHVFLLNAVVLRSVGYPIQIIILQVLQYVFSIALWSRHVNPSAIRPYDRGTAIINIVFLASEHLNRECDVVEMVYSMGTTLLFFGMHCLCRRMQRLPEGQPTVWYICWHYNLGVNNVKLALYRGCTLTLFSYMLQMIVCFFIWIHK
mgnify:CR=1 FL=1